MALSSIGDGGVHNGGVLWQCGVYNGSNPSLFGQIFVDLHILLLVRINYYACGYFITRAAVRLRLPYTDMT